MSYNRVEHAIDDFSDVSPIRRSSMIVNSTTSRKKHQHHHRHHRSSITTTSSSSLCSSSFRRQHPISSFHSIGTPPSPTTYIDNSPLNDLRERLASAEGRRHFMFSRPAAERSSRIIGSESRRLWTAASPRSAPATLEVHKFDADDDETGRGSTSASPLVTTTTNEDENNETVTVTLHPTHTDHDDDDDDQCRQLETKASIRLDSIMDGKLTTQTNDQNSHMQVVEVKDVESRDCDTGNSNTNDCTIVIRRRRDDSPSADEPIVEIRQTSSSDSSPSRHSSPDNQTNKQSTNQSISLNQHQNQHQHHQHTSGHHSSSSSSSSTSSRRLIRRRTVRRSYHHRALEGESGESPKLLVVTTTTTTSTPSGRDSSAGGGGDDDNDDNDRTKTTKEIETTVDNNTNKSSTRSSGQQLTVDQHQHHHKLSTSTSSSKIATSHHHHHHHHHHQHHKKSTQTLSSSNSSSTNSSSCSTNRSQTIKQLKEEEEEQRQQTNKSEKNTMISTTNSQANKTIDLNNSDQHHHQQSLFERRNRPSSLIERAETGSVAFKQEEEESSVHHRELSSINKSSRFHNSQSATAGATTAGLATAGRLQACETSSTSSSLSRSATKMMSSTQSSSSRDATQQTTTTKSADLSTSASHHQYKSVFLSSAAAAAASAAANTRSLLQVPEDHLFSSPDAKSFAQEIVTDFAELENALSSTSFDFKKQQQQATRSSSTFGRIGPGFGNLPTRLFGDDAPSIHAPRLRLRSVDPPPPAAVALKNEPEQEQQQQLTTRTSSLFSQPESNRDESSRGQDETNQLSYNSGKIRELLDKAQRHGTEAAAGSTLPADSDCQVAGSGKPSWAAKEAYDEQQADRCETNNEDTGVNCRLQEKARCKKVMSEKIERFDQKMSDLCKKLEACNDTQKAIDLMKIMIQMIEKAWSLPVCADDLGFRLCNSLRHFGGLDIILGFIHEADERSLITGPDCDSAQVMSTPTSSLDQADKDSHQQEQQQQQQQQRHRKQSKQLRLNLSKIHQQQQQEEQSEPVAVGGDNETTDQQSTETINGNSSKSAPIVSSNCPSVVDNDSEILTSDLGLDSTSVESLSYVSATGVQAQIGQTQQAEANEKSLDACQAPTEDKPAHKPDETEQNGHSTMEASRVGGNDRPAVEEIESEEMKRVRRDELVFLSAHLLSHCLTSENRDYIVKFGLDPVIKLACNFTTMKSGHSKRLLKRSALMRQSSTMKQRLKEEQQQQQQQHQGKGNEISAKDTDMVASEQQQQSQTSNDDKATTTTTYKQHNQKDTSDTNQDQRSDLHSAIGTEILQHLFKHSEETCWRMISLGALQAILYGCRSSHIETLRHCASALANLALYGGPDSQQMMIEQKAHVWLFPLAFNEDDNVQYYACLAIVVLAANQEIEADVLQSSTLDLVDPFVTSHEPRKFAESTTSHIHGQSAGWLKKLMPLLESKREETRNLACFHFAMEAYIKREQGQTSLFREIGSIEYLKKAGSSPIAIASKFACQALRLIGEREPHKLSQQVPLWSCDDVCEWVNQVGFEKFQPAFRDSFVDGDLLLQLDEQQLKFDIGIENGIIRRRFLRELSNLKRIADYSSVDRGGLSSMLINSTSILNTSLKNTTGNHQLLSPNMINCSPMNVNSSSSAANRNARDFLQYIYPILKIGVTKDNIHLIDCEQLLADCKISNTLHRLKLAHAIRELQDRILLDAATNQRDSLGGEEQKTLDVFVSYRRSTGSQLASLLKVHLQLRGFSVFIDVERLEAGKFDNNLLDSIKTAKNFILVLSPNALDRCIGDHERKDWVHKEIVAAMESKCNIIPIIDNFHWPDPEQLPEDMRSITTFNGIRWYHDYQDACVEKVERFIRGELSNSMIGNKSGAGSIISSVSGSAGGGGGGGGGQGPGNQTASVGGVNSFQRLTSAAGCNQGVTSVSTPSIIATTPSLCSNHVPYSQLQHHHQLPHHHQHHQQNKNHPTQSAEHQHNSYTAAADSNHHPLAAAYTAAGAGANLYLQQNLRIGNSNNNVRLQ